MQWRKSTFCDSGNCVEAGASTGTVGIRNSGAPWARVFFSPDDFAKFLDGVKAGEFDDLVEEARDE